MNSEERSRARLPQPDSPVAWFLRAACLPALFVGLLLCASRSPACPVLTARTEDLYFKSINTTVDQYRDFYSDRWLPLETKKDTAQWQSVLASLHQWKSATPDANAAPGMSPPTPR